MALDRGVDALLSFDLDQHNWRFTLGHQFSPNFHKDALAEMRAHIDLHHTLGFTRK